MVNVELQDNEVAEMTEILESYLHELAEEIGYTDTRSFRQTLKQKRAFVIDMLDRLTEAA
jgi:hypothetical protein